MKFKINNYKQFINLLNNCKKDVSKLEHDLKQINEFEFSIELLNGDSKEHKTIEEANREGK